MGNWIDFKEVRAHVSLEDVILRYYKIENLKRDGTKLIGPCPVHGGDSPRAFHADLDKNVWHCFSQCQKGGNQLDFVALKENIGIREAALRLQAFLDGGTPAHSDRPKAPVATTPPPSTPEMPAPQKKGETKERTEEEEVNAPLNIKLDLKPDHPHLIEDRKLQLQTVEHFGLGYCGRGIMRGMIAIPIHDEDGDLVAYAGRRLKPSDIREFGKYKLPKGFKKERILFNYHRAKALATTDGLILVEGFFSVLKLHEAGLTSVVASMGCELSEYQVKLLASSKEVILLFDGDAAGRAGAVMARNKLAPHTLVRMVHLPEGTKPDALSQKALRWIVNGAKALNLAEVSFAFQGEAPPASADTTTQ